MRYRITCACGWETSGTEDEVVDATRDHGRALHNMEVDRDGAMAMAVPLDVPESLDP
jgi:hypothetical protein